MYNQSLLKEGRNRNVTRDFAKTGKRKRKNNSMAKRFINLNVE